MAGLFPESTVISERCIHGNVTIAPGVVIASGVILGTDAHSQLTISTGVCLGPDVVLQAQGGDLVIEPNVSLGAGVLVVGQGRIGSHTCIGSGTTLINPQLRSHQVVGAKSLLGDPSSSQGSPPEAKPGPDLNSACRAMGLNGRVETGIDANGSGPADTNLIGETADLNHQPSRHSVDQNGQTQNGSPPVYGRDQVSQLLDTLFPHRRALNASASDASTPEDIA